MRTEFEKRIITYGAYSDDIERNTMGNYKFIAWIAWKAAWQAAKSATWKNVERKLKIKNKKDRKKKIDV